MDRIATYDMIFTFPFNKETSTMYTDDPDKKMEAISLAVRTIDLVISSHGFISLERVMTYFELRPTRHCPCIYFTSLDKIELEYDNDTQSDIIVLYLLNDFKLRPVIRKDFNIAHEKEKYNDEKEAFKLHVVKDEVNNLPVEETKSPDEKEDPK